MHGETFIAVVAYILGGLSLFFSAFYIKKRLSLSKALSWTAFTIFILGLLIYLIINVYHKKSYFEKFKSHDMIIYLFFIIFIISSLISSLALKENNINIFEIILYITAALTLLATILIIIVDAMSKDDRSESFDTDLTPYRRVTGGTVARQDIVIPHYTPTYTIEQTDASLDV